MRLLYEIHVTVHVPVDLHLTDAQVGAHEAELIAVLERAAQRCVADTGLQLDVDVSY